jgi:hypothetical protein
MTKTLQVLKGFLGAGSDNTDWKGNKKENRVKFLEDELKVKETTFKEELNSAIKMYE